MTRMFAKFAAEVSAAVLQEPEPAHLQASAVPKALALVGRYSHKRQPADLVKAAAKLYLLWREHQPGG